MAPPGGLTSKELEQQAAILQQLIDDAQALQKEITDHLKRIRRENRSNAQAITERRKESR
jgi:hypothetical protein